MKPCVTCGVEFEIEKTSESFGWAWMIKNCAACSDSEEKRKAAELEAAKKQDLETRWLAICPPLFRETEIERLPIPSKAAECFNWGGEHGLMLFGDTRKGKSRCAWLLLRREYDKKRKITVMDSLSGLQYGSIFSGGGRDAETWVMSRCTCDVLFLDDVFKVKLTDSFEAAMFAIVDYRLNHKKTILATCNDTGASLAGRMSVDRGAAFVARLKESCETICF